jgi:hypothetical protein
VIRGPVEDVVGVPSPKSQEYDAIPSGEKEREPSYCTTSAPRIVNVKSA